MKKKKSKKKHKCQVVCSCCKNSVYEGDMSKTLGKEISIWGINIILKIEHLIHRKYQWACDACLSSGKAILANPAIQQYCDYLPYLAYFDLDKTCQSCNADFVFSQEEQQFYYEKMKFWVQAIPNTCKACRKKNKEKKELSDLLKNKENLGLKEWKRLADIYASMGKTDKSNYYKNQINKHFGK